MLQEGEAQVVQCGDLDCKLCTAARVTGGEGGGGESASSNHTAYEVYTCESPMCSLCREEPDILLDLFCPYNSIQDIREITRKMSNISGMETNKSETNIFSQADDSSTPLEEAWWDSEPNSYHRARMNNGSSNLLELLQSAPRERNNEAELDMSLIDDTCLMDLALELQVDKLSDLPELREGLIEFV